MKARRRYQVILATLLFFAVSLGTLAAQNDPNATADNPSGPPPANSSNQGDPPGRVARIQYMSGEVSMQPGGANDWVAASQNRPLTTSDRVWTDKNSKAELNTGDGYVRMSSETSLTLTSVSDNTVQLELDQGTLELTVRHLEGGEIYEVDTPNAAFTVMKSGVYRFDVYPNEDQTWATTRSGYMEATGKGAAVKIKSGSQVRFSNGTSLQYTAEQAPDPDGFDDWVAVRDKRLSNSVSARYVSPGVVGYQDLDDNGTWRTVPTYGNIWVPNSVPVGWAPYRYGHWAWIDPWGWTWVDDASWGFAPFHYGRWVYYGGGWGWAPGPVGYWRPYYAPALVGWVGGAGFGFGFGFGGAGWGVGVSFGWFPLGWGEPFYPWYGGWGWRGGYWRSGYWGGGGYCSRNYINRVNITNTHITNITNITNNYYTNNIHNTHFVNQHIANAVTAAPASALAKGEPISKAGMAVPQSGLRNAHLMRTAEVTPSREARLGGHAPLTTPPAHAFNRQVVTKATPPARPTNSQLAATGNAKAAEPGTAHNNIATPHTGNPETDHAVPNANKPAAENQAAHNVPRPPSAGGSTTIAHNNLPEHTVPRPPDRTSTLVHAPNTGTSAATQGGTNAASEAGTHNVPRPPANYSYGANRERPTGTNAPVANAPGMQPPHVASPAPAHPTAPSGGKEAAPQHGNPPHQGSSASEHQSTASNVPRPPANYAYHAAPARTPANTQRPAVSAYAGNAQGSRAPAPAYGANRGYQAPPANRGGYAGYRAPQAPVRNYSGGGGPVYSAHASAPPAYSGPRGGGGYSGGGHPSGGAPSGGGGHASGGGGGGSHHGR